MALPYMNNDYLQSIGSYGASSVAAPQSMNLTGAPVSQIPLGQFNNSMDAASDWTSSLNFGRGAGSGTGGFGFNIPTAQLALGSLNSLGNIWGAMQAQKLARDNFNFTKDVTNTNLTNSIQSYNTALTDKLTSRAKAQGMSDADRDAQIAANRLVRS